MRKLRRRHTPTVPDSVKASRAGFGLSELLVVIAITGVLISVTVPMVLSYYHNAQNKTGAQQIRTLLNQARQIAIDQATFVCVQVSTPTQMSFYVNTACTGTPWLGTITDAAGNITLQPGFTVSASASPVFDYLGRSLPEATYTVTNTTSGSTLTVSVATSGRVTIP
jgi:prepilin-type N-terminal cleavage/methylation domain-containing protein